MAFCPSCGQPVPAGARFCPSCAAPIGQPAPRDEERKVATVLFADLVGSTELAGSQDPERTRALLNRFYDAMATLREFDKWAVRDVRREHNVRADELVNEALDEAAARR